LEKNDISTTQWTEIHPKSPFYFFVPRDEALLDRYQQYPKIIDIFPVNSVGIVTARDHLTIRWTPNEVLTTVLNFSKLDPEMAREAYELGNDARDWKVKLAQEDLKSSGLDREKVVPILYRPFDVRYTYYTGKSRGFHCMPRSEVMQHMFLENLGLMTCRQLSQSAWSHAMVTERITDDCMVSNRTRERGYLLPLYLYPEADLLTHVAKQRDKKINLNPALLQTLRETHKGHPSPEDIFYYVYAVLYSPSYRKKYAEFLKSDFPRVPFTKDRELFLKLAKLGEKLVDLHLLRSKELDKPICRFQGKGDDRVEKQAYNEKEKRVYINKTQYFEGVEPAVWEYQIGGYQVLDKWLKDRRKQRPLSTEDIKHYCRVVTALAKTVEIQTEIDALYAKLERAEPVNFKL
jgi:predicted helicase